MSKVIITADSTCDLGKDYLNLKNIPVIPLYVTMEGNNYSDGVDITAEDIFKHVDDGGDLPGTSAASIGDYTEVFTRLREQGDEVVHVSISSELSAAYKSACIAAEAVGGVHVVDSYSLSTGIGLVIRKGVQMAEEGKFSAEEIAETLRGLTGKVKASFVLDRLDYLRKGGRCTALQALGANLLKLKPALFMRDGRLQLGQKYRGSFARALENYIDTELSADRDNLDTSCIFITHSRLDDDTIVDMVREKIAEYAQFDEVVETAASCVISSHCGPNTLGILYMLKD